MDRQVRARVIGASRTEVLPRVTDAMALLDPELAESDGGLMASTLLAVARQRCLVVLLTDLNPRLSNWACCPESGCWRPGTGCSWPPAADPRLAELAACRADLRRCTGGRGRAGLRGPGRGGRGC